MPSSNKSMATRHMNIYLSINHTIRKGSVRIPQKILLIKVLPYHVDPCICDYGHKCRDNITYPKGVSHVQQ